MPSSTSSGASSIRGRPGRSASAMPAMTSRIDGAVLSRRATTATTTRTARSSRRVSIVAVMGHKYPSSDAGSNKRPGSFHSTHHMLLGKRMASDNKKTKAEAAPKKDAATKVESPAAEAAPKDASKDTSKKDSAKAEGGETAAAAPANYSRGEGQKPVTAAYKENWNAIFGKKG